MIHKARLALRGRIPMPLKAAYLKIRELDAGSRAAPDFLILGAMKAGTTSLFNYLCLHPRVMGSVPKEIFFFNSHFEKGERWYRRHFPSESYLKSKGAICGEATPTYLYSELAAARMSRMIPRARLLVLLRDPTSRAISHYYHRVRTNREKRDINEVFSIENINRWMEGKGLSDFDAKYFNWSCYASHLGFWMNYFPRSQFLILRAEDFFQDVQGVYDQVCHFLDLTSRPVAVAKKYNASTEEIVLPETIQALRAAFSREGQKLEGIEVTGWSADNPPDALKGAGEQGGK